GGPVATLVDALDPVDDLVLHLLEVVRPLLQLLGEVLAVMLMSLRDQLLELVDASLQVHPALVERIEAPFGPLAPVTVAVLHGRALIRGPLGGGGGVSHTGAAQRQHARRAEPRNRLLDDHLSLRFLSFAAPVRRPDGSRG